MSQFESVSFKAQKYLLSFSVGENRVLPTGICPYTSLKSTATKLKKLGCGEWKVSKKGLEARTLIERIK